jgi:hypothetical protein
MIKETEMTAATTRTVTSRRPILAAGLVSAVVLALALCAGPASAATPAPGFTIHSLATPTNFSAADTPACSTGSPYCDAYVVTVRNAGSRATDGSVPTITDHLPAGLTVQGISFIWHGPGARAAGLDFLDLAGAGLCTATPVSSSTAVQCTLDTARFEYPPPILAPDDILRMTVYVTVDAGPPGPLTNSATISGGSAPDAIATSQNQIGSSPPSFGPAGLGFQIAGLDGAPSTQAGDHPYELTTLIDLNNIFRNAPDTPYPRLEATSVEDPKNIVVDLPLGFLGSATASPTCTFAQLSDHVTKGESGCPTDTVVGRLDTIGRPTGSQAKVDGPIYNMVPEHGVAAEFAYVDNIAGSHALYARVVPGPSGYVLQVTSADIPQIPLINILATFFGNPAAKDNGGSTPAAMFTNPSHCDGQPLTSQVHMDSWQHPGTFNADGTPNLNDPNWLSATTTSPPVTGCNKLHFKASIAVQPDTTSADSPSGLDVEIKVPQSENPATLATPPLKKGVVTLPQGVTVNPSFADGLGACSPAQIDLASAAEPTCPEASKLGTVELQTPLLPGILHGSIFLATQNDNPFHSLLAGYIVIDDPTTGIVVKIPGELKANPVTGQITGVFDNNPQFPFSDLKLHFFAGNRGELATPQACGTFPTTSDLMPWSAPDSGPDATPSDSFNITSNCAFAFNPAFSAGTVNNQAGAFSPLIVTIARQDGEQHLTGLTVTTPPGLLASLKGIPLCPEAQANAAACPAASQIGETTVSSGVGPDPYVVHGGRVYLTGPYNGGPFGLSVVVPAVAGPFNLGNVLVRSSIRINPVTSQVTVVSDPLPQMVNSVEGLQSGIPADIRTVNVTINRPNFTFNATSCTPLAVTGSISGAQGAAVPVSSRYQAANCQSLPFHPTLQASTGSRASKSGGASLTVKVTSGPGQANIAKTDLTLPIALPSRLSTIQKACVAAIFAANPATCPEGSVIGSATAHTPLLNSPLVGPAYLVSHGGAAFPDVEFVLQGEGVKLILDGQTDIKKGITYSRFETVPDAPVTSFEAVLPTGPHSALAAFVPGKDHYNLCAANLAMGTVIVGQNGAVIKKTTTITPRGCPKHAHLTRAQHLAKALAACKKKAKSKRAACKHAARKKYGKAARRSNTKHTTHGK